MQEKAFQRLFTPLKIRGVELKNRIVMTPVQVKQVFHNGTIRDHGAQRAHIRSRKHASTTTQSEGNIDCNTEWIQLFDIHPNIEAIDEIFKVLFGSGYDQ